VRLAGNFHKRIGSMISFKSEYFTLYPKSKGRLCLMNPAILISVIIVNYNEKILVGLSFDLSSDLHPLEVILVDNA
jgi:hypothetical protein